MAGQKFKALSGIAIFLASAASADAATVISSNAGGTITSAPVFFGQSFSVSGSDTYDNVAFSFLSASGLNLAAGNLYLFSSAYTGTPSGLALASNTLGAASANNGKYVFANNLQLVGGNRYFAYSDARQSVGGGNLASGGNFFFSGASGNNFVGLGPSTNYVVTGDVVSLGVPEPTSWALMIAGMGFVGLALRARSVVRQPYSGV